MNLSSIKGASFGGAGLCTFWRHPSPKPIGFLGGSNCLLRRHLLFLRLRKKSHQTAFGIHNSEVRVKLDPRCPKPSVFRYLSKRMTQTLIEKNLVPQPAPPRLSGGKSLIVWRSEVLFPTGKLLVEILRLKEVKLHNTQQAVESSRLKTAAYT